MRLKVILPVLGITGVLLVVVFAFRPPVGSGSDGGRVTGDQVPPKAENSATPETTAAKPSKIPGAAVITTPAGAQGGGEADLTVRQDDAYVVARIDELADLGMTSDPDSLNTILSELTNRDPQIRKAALSAAIQFGSRDAIPAMKDAILQTDDPQEKVDLQKAIDFLKLPRLLDSHPPALSAAQ